MKRAREPWKKERWRVSRGVPRDALRIALYYPGNYSSSITNLFTHEAYYYLKLRSKALVDRFTSESGIMGIESGLRIREFDVVLASITYELDVLELIRYLGRAGIPITAKSRKETHPLVVVGGPVPTANPSPLTPFADAVHVGEGEPVLRRLTEAAEDLRHGVRRDELLAYLVGEGMYLGGEGARRVYWDDINDNDFIPPVMLRSDAVEPVYGRGYYIEATRGCPHLCGFCMEARVSWPFRARNHRLVVERAVEGAELIGERRAVIYSLSFFDHPRARDILDKLHSEGLQYSLPSIRYDTLSQEDVELIARGGQRTLTLAPETGSREAGCLIRKCLDEERLVQLAEAAGRFGMKVKLYFIFGLPGEGGDAPERAAEISRRVAKGVGKPVRATINPLVPKPNTPTQYIPLMVKDEFLEYIEMFRRAASPYAKPDYFDWGWAHAQAVIALASADARDFLIEWATRGITPSAMRRAASITGYDIRTPLRCRDPEAGWGWKIVDMGYPPALASAEEAYARRMYEIVCGS